MNFDPTHPPLGDARTGPGRADLPRRLAGRCRETSPAAGGWGAVSIRMPLGYDGLWPAPAWPTGLVRPDPVAGGPTRAHVQFRRLGESGRGGGCSESDHIPSQKLSGQQAQ